MDTHTLSKGQRYSLIALRLFIGWHFLYEGVLKLYNPSWTAKGYLLSAAILKPFFIWLGSASMIGMVDTLNIVGLLAIGSSLLLGVKVRWGALAGIALLALYYLAHPPFPGIPQGPAEGSYWLVNKNLIELVALWVIFAFPSVSFGIEHFFSKKATA